MSSYYKKKCNSISNPYLKQACYGVMDVPSAFYLDKGGKASRKAIGRTAQTVGNALGSVAVATGFGEIAPALMTSGSEINRVISSFKDGGKVSKTVVYKLHKNEIVVPASRVKAVRKAVRKAGLKPLH